MADIEEGNRPSGRAVFLGRTSNHITGKIGILKWNEGQLALYLNPKKIFFLVKAYGLVIFMEHCREIQQLGYLAFAYIPIFC